MGKCAENVVIIREDDSNFDGANFKFFVKKQTFIEVVKIDHKRT